MIKEAFGKGATTEEALENARANLNAPEDADVTVELTKTPTKKILGLFGGSLAEARAYYEIPDPKPEVKKEHREQIKKQPAKQPKANDTAPAKKENKKPEAKTQSPKVVKEVPAAEVKPAEQEDVKKEITESSEKAAEYITKILNGMGIKQFELSSYETDEGIEVQLDCGNDFGYIIGRRGETLDAIQYLTRLVINKGTEGYKRVSINAGNYREKREVTLRELAKRNAAKAKKYGRSVSLDPMNPYERRIIHTTIQEIEGVDSHSVGSESERRVIITLTDEYRQAHPGKSSRGGRSDYRHKGRSQKQEAPVNPDRAPLSDSAGINLYGKIEPKAKVSSESQE